MLNPRQLVFLVAAALLPVVLFTALVVAHFSGVERSLIEERLRGTAVAAAATVDRQLAREIAAVQTLATSEALQQGDFAAFDRTARRALWTSSYWLSVILTDETGQLVNTRLPYGAALPPILSRAQVEEVFRTGRPVVSGVQRVEERLAEPFVAVRVPVFVEERVKYTLLAALPAWAFHAVLGEHPTMSGSRLMLLDRDDRMIARTLSQDQHDPLVGGLPTPSQRAGIAGGTSGRFEAVALDGAPMFGVYATAPLSGWKVLVGTPSAVIRDTLRQAQWALFGGGALALALAGYLAYAMIRSMTRRQLAERRLADLQAEKATERRLGDIAAKHTERLDFALDCANAGLWDWDLSSGRVTWSNSQWRLFGYAGQQGEPTLEHLERRLHPDDRDRFWNEVHASVDSVSTYVSEFRVVDPGGEVRWLAAIGRTFGDGTGTTVRMTGLNLDITDRKAIEVALRAAKDEAERANVTKSKFLAAASHDLRQPVQSLLFFIHVLGERLAGHEAQALVGTMHQALDALKGLLDGILDLSKLDAGVIAPQVQSCPLGPLLERLEAEYAPRFAAKRLDLTMVPTSLGVDSDVTLLGRILGNLIENALKYTANGGVLVGCRRHGRTLRIEVWDTGIGIPPDRLEDIFDEFVQIGNPARDRTQGLGLGLAIVKRLARLLGHRLDVRSRPGHGSVFSVEVPLSGAESWAPDAGAVMPSAAASAGALAVIIDDEAIILEGLRVLLETWGYAVVDAQDAATALARVEALGRAPDVVVADFRLRHGRTGVEAIALLRTAFGAALPGILLTGDTGPGLLAEADALGLATLHKPVPPGELRRLMQELVTAPPAPVALG
jgi:signal transduction histidine kinase/CheY-like chemotaxis protein